MGIRANQDIQRRIKAHVRVLLLPSGKIASTSESSCASHQDTKVWLANVQQRVSLLLVQRGRAATAVPVGGHTGPRKVKILEHAETMGDWPTRFERPWQDVTRQFWTRVTLCYISVPGGSLDNRSACNHDWIQTGRVL
jgi:hypothetical protein